MPSFKELQESYETNLENLKEKLGTIRTGRAGPAMVENILIDAYGAPAELKTLAAISSPEPRQLLISPFDPSLTQAIEQGIAKSELGINPIVEGNNIRLTIPPMTEEKRQEMVKLARAYAEESHIRLRQLREEAIKELKTKQSAGEITEDDLFSGQREIQTLIEDFNTRIDDALAKREQEILTV